MNTTSNPWRWAWLSLILLASPDHLARAATFSLDAAIVTNTSTGPITMTIGGLTNGEPVLVEKFQDANANGAADAGEPLVSSFLLRDGEVSSIAGVRNRNIPGDDDLSANGQIVSTRSLLGMVELERAIGQYVYRVSSPTARFEPVTRAFAVTMSGHAQGVSGTVTNTSGSAVAYAGVAALDSTGEFVAATLANSGGAYSLPLPTGGYQLVTVSPGYVANIGALPQIAIETDLHLTNNLSLVPGTRTLSGIVRDAQTEDGLPGLQIFLESAAGEIVLTFTDAGGSFSALVTPGEWAVQVAESALRFRGFLFSENPARFSTVAGDVSGLAIEVTRGTSLVYGSVTDDQAQKVVALPVYCSNDGQTLEGTAITDANGQYLVLGGSGTWSVGFSDQALAQLGLILSGTNVTLVAGQALPLDFRALRATARLRGVVHDTSSPANALANLEVLASPKNGTQVGGPTATWTGPDGTFELPVFGGLWQVQLEARGAADRGFLAPTREYTVTNGVDINDIELIAPPITAHLTGQVTNHLGQGVADLEVYGYRSDGATIYNATAMTDANGYFSLGADAGIWHVGLPRDPVSSRGYVCPSEELVTISGATGTVVFPPLTPFRAPTATALNVVGDSFRCDVSGQQNVLYRVWSTSDFLNWSELGTYWGATFQFADPVPQSSGQRFYRVEVVP